MNGSDSNEQIKKENRKALKIFIPVIILAAMGGGAFGWFVGSDSWQHGANDMGKLITDFFFYFSPHGVIFCESFAFLMGLFFYCKAKQSFSATNALEMTEDVDEAEVEKLFEMADRRLEFSMMAQSFGMIISFLFFGIIMSGLDRYIDEGGTSMLVATGFFIFGSFIVIRLNQAQVDLVKKMYPGKAGSVYDFKFHDKWEKSCDELEKLVIYKAGFKAYKAGSSTCVALWIITSMLSLMFGFGPIPSVSVIIVWLVMFISYSRESLRSERSKINE
ncbi:MAG: DUF3169 family protein [Firmicutes bacterium]|nr:DUF3169 family protein [Bacillota bacterium]